MSSAPSPKISRAPTFSLIWIVPVVALLIGGWMIFRELRTRGPEIVVEFPSASGIEEDKTVVEYRGLVVGKVTQMAFNPDLSGVELHVRLYKSATALATTEAKFWIVRPEIGLSGISGVETLVSGVRLHLKPGPGGPAIRFTGLTREPPPENTNAGRAFIMQSDRLGALTSGAPVFYREIKVGAVETSWLSDDATGVLVRIRIFTPFINLVRTNSQFWNAGGVSLKVGLLGAEIKSTSLESLIAGGIAFATPDNGASMPVAEEGAVFKLYAEADKEAAKWQPKIQIKSPEMSPEARCEATGRSVINEAVIQIL